MPGTGSQTVMDVQDATPRDVLATLAVTLRGVYLQVAVWGKARPRVLKVSPITNTIAELKLSSGQTLHVVVTDPAAPAAALQEVPGV